MDIKDIINSNLEVNVTIKASDLREVMCELIEEVHNRATANTQTQKEDDELLIEQEVRELLGVSHSTLWKWAKLGILPRIELGGMRRWRLSDVNKLLSNRQ